MRGSGPAAMTAGVIAALWVLWEAWRLVWLGQFTVGIQGVYVIQWVGPGGYGHPDGGAGTLVVLPLMLGALSVIVGSTMASIRPSGGPWVLAVGGGMMVAWAGVAGALSLGSLVDGWLQLPLFAVKTDMGFTWAPWARWIFDGACLVAVCSLFGFGPDTAPARRALWIGLLMLIADNGWRVAVLLFSGGVPLLSKGLVLGWGTTLVWALLAVLALGFLALFANLPHKAGPHRLSVYVGLGLAGLWQGGSAALLWIAPLLDRAGINPLVHAEMPEYDGLLALLRLGLFAIGSGSLAFGVWRSRR